MYLDDGTIERFIKEDVPYFDLTTHLLDLAGRKGKIEFVCREEAVICGTEEITRILRKLDCIPLMHLPSGTKVDSQTNVLTAEGPAENLHMAWKVSQNILEYSSGIATRTNEFVELVRQVNPNIEVLTTRKVFPGTKELSIKAIIAGGSIPHRLGLSETVLVFKQHMDFIGGVKGLLPKINELKARGCEKKIIVETEDGEEAMELCRAGVDGIQFDKVAPENLEKTVPLLKALNDKIVILAAGGINRKNVQIYAQTGIDGIVTTSLYFGKPVDFGVRLVPC